MGLDLSTITGLSIVEFGRKVVFVEEIQFKKERGMQRICNIAERIVTVRDLYKPDLIVIEELFIGRTSSAIVLAEISAIVRYFLWLDDSKFITLPAATLKRWLTGKGNSQKDVMMMEVYKQFEFESKTNNIADAIALGMYGLCTLGDTFSSAQKTIATQVEKIKVEK